MGFNNLNGLWLLLAVPLILLFYLYREKNKKEDFPSLFIWDKLAEKKDSGRRAFNKLFKRLILFLQLMAVVLFSMYVSEPYIKKNYNISSIIIIADCSISMKTKNNDGTTYFDDEINAVNELINSLDNKCIISVISSGKNPEIIVNKEGKNEAERAVKELEAENANYNTDEAVALAERLSDSDTEIYLFSCKRNISENDRVKCFVIGGDEENTAIVSAFGDYDNKTVKAVIKNYGSSKVNRTVLLYGENILIDSREIEIENNEALSVDFKNVKNDYTYYKICIKEQEPLSEDDIRFIVLKNSNESRLAFLGEENYYIQRVINAAYKGKLYKADKYEDLAGEAFNTYIFNESIPNELPNDGNIIIINPVNSCSLFETDAEIKAGKITAEAVKGFEYFKNTDFSVSEFTKLKNISSEYNYYPVCLSSDDPVIYAGEENQRKIIIFAFDLSSSDLVFKSDFPVLFSDIFSDFSDNGVTEKEENLWGDVIRLNSSLYSEVIKPSGSMINISDRLIYADETGIYTVSDGDNKRLFAVNTDLSGSDSRAEVSEGENDAIVTNGTSTGFYGKNIKYLIFVFIIILVLGEWLVYNNDN